MRVVLAQNMGAKKHVLEVDRELIEFKSVVRHEDVLYCRIGMTDPNTVVYAEADVLDTSTLS